MEDKFLKPGTIIHDSSLITGKPYLKNYVLSFDKRMPKDKWPIIAKLS